MNQKLLDVQSLKFRLHLLDALLIVFLATERSGRILFWNLILLA